MNPDDEIHENVNHSPFEDDQQQTPVSTWRSNYISHSLLFPFSWFHHPQANSYIP